MQDKFNPELAFIKTQEQIQDVICIMIELKKRITKLEEKVNQHEEDITRIIVS